MRLDFARGRDKKKRKPKQNTLRGHMKKGAIVGAALLTGQGLLNAKRGWSQVPGSRRSKLLGVGLGAAAMGTLGAASGAGVGKNLYLTKRALAKDKSNFDYSRSTEESLLFIGEVESKVNFARPKGAKDKTKRSSKRKERLKGFATGLAIYAAYPAGFAIGSALGKKMYSNKPKRLALPPA